MDNGKIENDGELEFVPEEETISQDFRHRIDKLKSELAQCQKEKEEYLVGWQRAKADYLNFKRESEASGSLLREFSALTVWRKILKIIDSLQLAQKNLPHNLMTNDWASGVIRIPEQAEKMLSDEGIKRLELKGKIYDPQYAESVETFPDSQKEEGEIIEELERGYEYIRGETRILVRPAKVKIVKNK